MRFAGKVAIVTGAGSRRGIGRATALALAQEGADVVVVDINGAGADEVAGEVRALGRRALASPTDVADEDQVQAMVDAALKELGRIDMLVNNAGVARHHPVLEVSSKEWDWLIGIHLKGTFLCTKAVLPTMMQQRSGRIVSIASVNGERGGGLRSGAHYCAAKAGIMGFAKTVARQAAPYGITSNVVSPGYIDTDINLAFETPDQTAERRKALLPQIPLGRLGTAQDVAEAVVFLLSDSAAYITGEVLDVNGGLHID